MKSFVTKREQREQRHKRIRARVIGSAARPRLCVYRSLTSLFAQIIDDTSGKTIVSVGLKEKFKGDAGGRLGKVAMSYLMGKAIAEKAKEKNITAVVFDRGGNRYHGRIAAFADGAREGGLVF